MLRHLKEPTFIMGGVSWPAWVESRDWHTHFVTADRTASIQRDLTLTFEITIRHLERTIGNKRGCIEGEMKGSVVYWSLVACKTYVSWFISMR